MVSARIVGVTKTSVLIVDRQNSIRELLEAHLSQVDEFDVTSTSSVDEAINSVKGEKIVDLILMSFSADTQDSIGDLKKLMEAPSKVPVAVFSECLNKSKTSHLLKMGIQGHIPRSHSVRSMVNALKFIASGETYVPANFFSDTRDQVQNLDNDFSERELRVLRGLFYGKTNKEIGRELDLAEVTVKTHVRAICTKLGAKNRTHAAIIARHLDLDLGGSFAENV